MSLYHWCGAEVAKWLGGWLSVTEIEIFRSFFFHKISLEIVFGGVLDRKQASPDYKNVGFTW